MIVYTETNFIVELACGQEQAEHCERLLAWAAEGRIDLRLPATAFTEARTALRRKAAERLDLKQRLERQAREFRRVRELRDAAESIEKASQAVSMRSEQEDQRYFEVSRALRRHAHVIHLESEVFERVDLFRSLKLVRGEGDLLIFASVMRDLEMRTENGDTRPSSFATRDFGFDTAAPQWLREYGCTLLTSYSAALARLDTT